MKRFKINFNPHGLNSIITLLYKILIPYWAKSNIPEIKLNTLKKYSGSWEITRPLRNEDMHDPNIDENILIESLSLCMKCFRSLDEFENVLKNLSSGTREL